MPTVIKNFKKIKTKKGRGAMQITRLLPLVRTLTTLTPKHLPIIPSSSPPLLLEPYCEANPQDAVYLNNKKVDSLIKSGYLFEAHHIFDEMPMRDVVTYNLMVSAHGRYGIPEYALYLYWEMVSKGIRESPSTFSSILSICSCAGFSGEGIQVHCRVFKLGLNSNLFIGSALVGFYMQMGLVNLALGLFDELPERNLATWNLVLRGFCEMGLLDQLLGLYRGMKLDGVEGNGLTFSYVLHGCCSGVFYDEGRQIHCHVIKAGWVISNVFIANALVDFYSACFNLIDAEKSFSAIPVEDVISWNSIVSVYVDSDLLVDSLELFHAMQILGKRPSVRSFVGFLNLSSRTGNILLGNQIHCCVLKMGFDHASVYVQSALIDMYGKCKDIKSSVSVYESVLERTLECCNSLMTSFLHCGIVDDVIEMFGMMIDEGIGLDEVSLSTTLKALSVSALASLSSSSLVHCCIIKSGFEPDIAVSCSLIEAYSRCGNVQLSQQVFDLLPSPNVICFTSIINGYARNGLGRKCLEMLEDMVRKGLKPDRVTFLCALMGCSHSGLVEEGRLVFDSMKSLHGISPDREHFSCMVDLLGRAGLLDEAEELLQNTPGRGDCVMWSSLLRSSSEHKNEMMGRRAAKVLLDLNPEHFAVYLQISKFYAEIGEFEASMQVREIAIARRITSEIGHSSIEVKNFH